MGELPGTDPIIRRSGFDEKQILHRNKRKIIGEGAFATVYKMDYKWPNGITQTLAIKVLEKGLLDDEDKAEDMAYEARVQSGCDHPSIVRFVGWGVFRQDGETAAGTSLKDLLTSGEEVFLAQEYVSGGTLKDAVMYMMSGSASAKKMYTWRDALRWAQDIADGLQYLHDRDPLTIHRDIKPENILLTSNNYGEARAKLTDFGLAKLVSLEQVGGVSRLLSSSQVKLVPLQRKEYLAKEENKNFSGHARSMYREWREKNEMRGRVPSNLQTIVEGQKSDVEGTARGKQRVLLDAPSFSRGGDSSDLDRHDRRNLHLRESAGSGILIVDLGEGAQGGPSTEHKSMFRKGQNLHALLDMTGRTGSAMYMAPEVFRNEAYGERSDVFSFGVMIFEALRSRLNVVNLDYGHMGMATATWNFAKSVANGYRPQFPEDWPPQVSDLLRQLMADSAEDRPPFDEVSARIAQLLVSPEVGAFDEARQNRRAETACQCTVM